MRIIDFESLASKDDAEYVPADPHSFHMDYDNRRPHKSALSFLWWQCILIAYSWLKEVKSKDVDVHVFVQNCSGGNIGMYIEGLSKDETM